MTAPIGKITSTTKALWKGQGGLSDSPERFLRQISGVRTRDYPVITTIPALPSSMTANL